MKPYSIRDVATMLGVSPAEIRSLAKGALLEPDDDGELRFSFPDLVLLRTTLGLRKARIPARKIRRAMEHLRDQLPTGHPLTGVRIAADGERIVVSDGDAHWNPDSGQALFDFSVSELATKVAPLAQRAADEAKSEEADLDAASWFELGCDLEFGAPEEARDAYRRAVELDPFHTDAHVNLGRMLHEEGETRAAESHYRIALTADPNHEIALFNLGVALEDMGRIEEAIVAYERAVEIDPTLADAHYNLATLYESLGLRDSAFRHLKAYRQLTGE